MFDTDSLYRGRKYSADAIYVNPLLPAVPLLYPLSVKREHRAIMS